MGPVDKHTLKSLISEVLRAIAPGEVGIFDQFGLRIILNELRKHESGQPPGGKRRGLPGVLEIGVVTAHLLAGTLAVVDIYRRIKDVREQRSFEERIQAEWQEALIAAGMDRELARQVPAKFCPEMIAFVTAQRLGAQPNDEQAKHQR